MYTQTEGQESCLWSDQTRCIKRNGPDNRVWFYQAGRGVGMPAIYCIDFTVKSISHGCKRSYSPHRYSSQLAMAAYAAIADTDLASEISVVTSLVARVQVTELQAPHVREEVVPAKLETYCRIGACASRSGSPPGTPSRRSQRKSRLARFGTLACHGYPSGR